ncbi:MAG: efflux RND transporter periplasmic adaptor subunit [Pseudomonadales bacterium]|nr:efflux RND transporter periplasmic adaptor subunit [Pseudomonadales bacterium]
MEIEEVIRASGTIAAKQTSRIGPLVEGVVDEIFVRVGDRPRRGDPLFRTRQNGYRQAVNEAQARLDVVRAELELKQKRFVRARSLVARNLLSQEQFELTETDVAVAQAQLRSAEAALATAEQQLGDTIVHAPFDGTITGRFADEGVYMSNRFSMGGQSAVVELAEAHIVAGIMQAPEAVLSRLRLGQRALLYVGESSPPRETEVFIINDRVDPATRMAEFRLPVRNDDYAIKPGQFVRAEVLTGKTTALTLPRSTIRETQGQKFVVLVDGQSTERRNVQVRDLNTDDVEVLAGLKEGDLVLLGPGDQVSETSGRGNLAHVDR